MIKNRKPERNDLHTSSYSANQLAYVLKSLTDRAFKEEILHMTIFDDFFSGLV
jgi:hypothetical protein